MIAAFSNLIENPRLGCVWVAWEQDAPIGHAVLSLRYTMEQGALSGYIDDLFVRPDYRRRGVARALLSVAGISGHTWDGCCEIGRLWVDTAQRRRGLGSALMAAAEAEAVKRGCTKIVLSTHSLPGARVL